ncbi:ABC transporter substrate-binding protein [Streptomyces yerevanensis]|uniref:ABC transporter substrate-binding protein n=1 Tax=Streptomyces yerevanensis TaxID=66378 RepID=UPI0005274975|nr:ABC transporter substrate-binding protein [Streptomyces yerevanensis]
MRRLLIGVVTVLAVLLAGCSTRSDSGSGEPEETSGAESSAPAVDGPDFGTLKNVCGKGDAKAVSQQGVTGDRVELGVFTDQGFTKNSEMVDAAKAFTSWCNDNGGINGRKLVPVIRDAKFLEVRQRMQQACKEDFMLVGGGASMDGLGTKDRLRCLLPAFPAQSSFAPAVGSDLQVMSAGPFSGHFQYAGFYQWLLKEKFPGSAQHVGIISGDSPVTKVLAAQYKESIATLGGKVSYSDLYPATGVSDWTPYAQALKKEKVKGLVFHGDFASLAKLEQALTSLGYAPDWIDANSNAYSQNFIQLAGSALGTQHNYTELFATHPLDASKENPAVEKVEALFAKYAPGKPLTYPALRAFSAWLLFATAARDCDELTRRCVYDNALKVTDWTAGGIQAPFDVSKQNVPGKCYSVVEATPKGWKPASFEQDSGPYRCDAPVVKFKRSYTEPARLADVGKSLSDLK